MLRMTLLVTIVVGAACKDGGESKGSSPSGGGGAAADPVERAGASVDKAGEDLKNKATDMVPMRAQRIVKMVDKGLTKLDIDEAAQYLASARDSLAKGGRADEACSWSAAHTGSGQPALDDLRKLCTFDVPLARATRAVVQAEKARAELPDAPSLTECSSDDWPAMKQALDGGAHAGEASWTALKARWTKVCP